MCEFFEYFAQFCAASAADSFCMAAAVPIGACCNCSLLPLQGACERILLFSL